MTMTPRRPSPNRLPIPALLALCALWAACGDSTSDAATDAKLFEVRRDDLPITVRENAELQALRETLVRSEVEGQATIIYIVPEGTQVKQGEKLVELDVSELVEKRANQAISVAKAEAALTQARKEKEILQKELSTKLNTALSNLRIADMELEKLLGRRSGGRSEGKNRDMIERVRALVNPPDPQPATTVAAAAPDDPEMMETLVTSVDPKAYAGLADKVYELLVVDLAATSTSQPPSPEALVTLRREAEERDMGDMANKILQQADAIKLAMADLKVKEDTFRHSWRLAKRQFITRSELEKDKLNYQSQMSKVSLAWNDLDLLVNYTLARERIKLTQDRDNASLELERVKGSNEAAVIKADSDLQSRVAEFQLAKERLDNLDRQIKSAVIVAPTPGTVVYARIDRNRGGGEAVREGIQVRERQELIILPDTTKMRCQVKVQEAQVDKVLRGQAATVTVEAFQGETFHGRVTSVAPVADSNSGWMTSDRKVYTTVVELDSDNPDGRLRSRMAANVTIMVDTVKDTLPVPLQAIQRDRAVNYVWKQTAEGPKDVRIRVGRQNTERVEVLEGLVPGDVIFLTPPTNVTAPKYEQPVVETPATQPAPTPTGTDLASSVPNPNGTGTPNGPGTPNGSGSPNGTGPDAARRPRQGGGMGTRKKFAEMTPEELQQAKDRLDGMATMIDRFREQLGEDGAKDLESKVADLRKALDANDLPTAQSVQDAISAKLRPLMGAGRGGPGGGSGRNRDGGGGNGETGGGAPNGGN
ncbi:MAG: efflux RND transporter periplasmic adaptor subunit [Planctomycetota bacterium]